MEGKHCTLHSFEPVSKHGIREAVIQALKQNLGCARNYLALADLKLAAYLRDAIVCLHNTCCKYYGVFSLLDVDWHLGSNMGDLVKIIWFGLLGFNTSAFLVEETGVP